jgi:hypothetical protein
MSVGTILWDSTRLDSTRLDSTRTNANIPFWTKLMEIYSLVSLTMCLERVSMVRKKAISFHTSGESCTESLNSRLNVSTHFPSAPPLYLRNWIAAKCLPKIACLFQVHKDEIYRDYRPKAINPSTNWF